jgi:hypothetical protein
MIGQLTNWPTQLTSYKEIFMKQIFNYNDFKSYLKNKTTIDEPVEICIKNDWERGDIISFFTDLKTLNYGAKFSIDIARSHIDNIIPDLFKELKSLKSADNLYIKLSTNTNPSMWQSTLEFKELWQALVDGSCPSGLSLDLSDLRVDETGFNLFMQSIVTGKLPENLSLSAPTTRWSIPSPTADLDLKINFLNFIFSGKCPSNLHLKLKAEFFIHEGFILKDLLNTLKSAAMQNPCSSGLRLVIDCESLFGHDRHKEIIKITASLGKINILPDDHYNVTVHLNEHVTVNYLSLGQQLHVLKKDIPQVWASFFNEQNSTTSVDMINTKMLTSYESKYNTSNRM